MTLVERRFLFTFALAIFAIVLLTACGTATVRQPEPIIRTVEVQVPVDDPACIRAAIAQLGPEPAYPDTDEALRSAPNVFERVKLLMAGRALRAARLVAKTAAMATCASGAPAPEASR